MDKMHYEIVLRSYSRPQLVEWHYEVLVNGDFTISLPCAEATAFAYGMCRAFQMEGATASVKRTR